MAKVPYTNHSKVTQHIGPCSIAPNETREVEETHLPIQKAREEQPPVTLEEAIQAILAHTIPEIDEVLPTLEDSDLDTLESMEKAGKNRDGVLKAVAAERLSRADAVHQVEEYRELLASMDVEELKGEVDRVQDEGLRSLIQEELENRGG